MKPVPIVEYDPSAILVPGQDRMVAAATKIVAFDPEQVVIKGDVPGHDFHGNQWTEGGSGSAAIQEIAKHSSGVSVDKLNESDNQALMDKLVAGYGKDRELTGAVDVVSMYRTNGRVSLATREIVAQSLAGKSAEQIIQDPKVSTLIEKANEGISTEYHIGQAEVDKLVTGTPGYNAAIRAAEPLHETVFRGTTRVNPKGEFELRGPTAFSHDKNVAMTYSNGTLFEVAPGSKMLPTMLLENVKKGAEGKTVTAPAFYTRASNAVDPRGPGHGFKMDLDPDKELTTSGRFRVVGAEKKAVAYRDVVTGQNRTRTVNVIKIEHIGVF